MNIEHIIIGCKNGDRKSQDLLVRKYAPLLMAVCQRYCKDSELAKDALQETFINIFKYIKGYNATGSFEGWIRRIAVNCSYGFLKKIRPVYFTEDIYNHSQLPSQVPEVYGEMGRKELMKIIKQLPEGQYLVFNMKVIEGYSHSEIAEILHIKASTSRSNLTRARVKLVQLLKEQEFIGQKRIVVNT